MTRAIRLVHFSQAAGDNFGYGAPEPA